MRNRGKGCSLVVLLLLTRMTWVGLQVRLEAMVGVRRAEAAGALGDVAVGGGGREEKGMHDMKRTNKNEETNEQTWMSWCCSENTYVVVLKKKKRVPT